MRFLISHEPQPSFRGREAEPGIQELRPIKLWIPGSALTGSPGMTPLEDS